MKKTIALIALLAAFPPLSTDMYLAAIPLLGDLWQQPLATINLTLVCFFISYCGFLLLYGPLSDRYGRRRPLLVGLCIYVVASLFCALADSVVVMILARILQGAGAAAASAIAFAICKDLFDGSLRQRIFLQLGIIVAAAPMVAPVIGGWIITFSSWRWIFILQVLFGLISITGVWLMDETLDELGTEKLSSVFKSYIRLIGNMEYLLLTLALSCLGIPFFAFIAASAEVYITGLGYTETTYGYFFAWNASAFMIAPLTFSRLARYFALEKLLPFSYLGVLVASLLMTVSLIPMPYRFAVPMWFLTFFFAFGRPAGNNLILEQIDQDVGAASSMMVFVFFMTGSCSMWFISHDWQDKVQLIGVLGTAAATITLASWLWIRHYLKLKLP